MAEEEQTPPAAPQPRAYPGSRRAGSRRTRDPYTGSRYTGSRRTNH